MTDTLSPGARSLDFLAGVDVLEISTRPSGAYLGRLLACLGARVTRFGPALELSCAPEDVATTEAWFHAGKKVDSSLTPPSAYPSVAPGSIVVVEVTGANAAWQEWGAELRRRADEVPEAVVITLPASVFEGEVVPGEALTSGAWSALSWSMGDADKAPLTLPYDIADFQAGIYGCAAALAALLAEPALPQLRRVEVAERDLLAYYVGMITANFIPYERAWTREGARPPGSAGVYPATIFPARDGHVVLMCRSKGEWHTLVEAMGSPDWAKDPKFEDPRVVARLHADEADSWLYPWVASKTCDQLMEIAQRIGLALAPIKSVREALDEPQFAHRDFFDATADGVQMPSVPWRFTETTPATAVSREWPMLAGATSPVRLFEGLRVLDLSWVWSGPLVTSVLGDLGAEILKIEHTGHLDTGRLRGKARRGGVEVEGPEIETTPYFNQMNHGKRSITADMKNPKAREILLKLAAECDVVVENMRPGVLDKLGLGYADFAAANPAIVMLSMSMAGQTGPLRTMKGYAGIMAAMSGLESLIGYDKRNIVGSLSPAIGDPNAGGHALAVLMAALIRRKATGKGVWIDLSQIEALMCVMPAPIVASQHGNELLPPANTHPRFIPFGHFPCEGSDQWIALAVRSDEEWAALTRECAGNGLDRPEWRTAAGRHADREAVDVAVATWTIASNRNDLVDRLASLGIAAAPVSSFEDLSGASWRKDRELTSLVQHPYLGSTEVYVVPWKFGGASAGRALPAPILGADTVDVLNDILGMTAREVGELRDGGVLR